jgi:uncharacterized protein with von Willebrand factor type A (vWA) domain
VDFVKTLQKLPGSDLARKTTRIARLQYEASRRRFPALLGAETGLSEHVHSDLSRASREFFGRLVDGGAQPLDDIATAPAKTAEFLHSQLDKSASWQKLEAACAGSATQASIATAMVVEELIANGEIPTFSEDVSEEDRAEELDFWIDAVASDEAFEEGDEAGARVRMAVAEACAKASDEVEAFRSACAVAGTTPADFDRADPSGAVELANGLRNDPALSDLIDRLGRMQRTMKQARRRVGTGAVVPVSVETGDDVTRLLPNERSAFANPATRLRTMAKLLRRECLTYKLRPSGSENLGPFVVVLDTSGSMQGRLKDAVAICLAAMLTARDEGRSTALIVHNTEARLIFESKFDDTAADWLSAMSGVARLQAGGGTHFGPALALASETIEAAPDFGTRADVLLITDGYGPTGANGVGTADLHLVQLAGASNPQLEAMAATVTNSNDIDFGAVAQSAAVANRRSNR